MSNKTEPIVLPHEVIFGAAIFIIWVRIAAGAGVLVNASLAYLLIMAVNVIVVACCNARPTNLRWRIRLFFYPVIMTVSFVHLRQVVPLIHDGKEDVLLQQWDDWLIGENLSLTLEPLVHPVLTEALSVCYAIFFPYLLFSFIWYLWEPLPVGRRFYAGLFSLYGAGFLGYTLVPAIGPYLAMADQFTVPLDGYWITDLNAAIYPFGTNLADVFPSLHVAVSCYILLFDFKHKRWRFNVYLVPCIGLWASTIYLRYHYFVDILAGLILAAAALGIAYAYFKLTQSQRAQA